MKENKRVALFIDAENISAKYADRLLQESASYGDVIVRRVFADWSSPNVAAWKGVVARHSLIAEQQFSAVKGKNSGDISLIINAMIVLFEKDIDVFCLASSDSDFTRLVQELREREKTVVGFGLKQTAPVFVNAFSEFIYLDSQTEEKDVKDKESLSVGILQKNAVYLEDDRKAALKDIIEKLIEEDGWALLARISTEMKNKYSDFVPKNYNCRSLKELLLKFMHEIGNYEIGTDTDGTTMFVMPKTKNTAKSLSSDRKQTKSEGLTTKKVAKKQPQNKQSKPKNKKNKGERK